MNQIATVKQYLEDGNTITSMQAIQMWVITRLSDKIFKLRKSGLQIDSIPTTSTNRYGDTVHFSTYRLSCVNEILKQRENNGE